MSWLRRFACISWLVLAVGCVIDLDPHEHGPELHDGLGTVDGDGRTRGDARSAPPVGRLVNRSQIRVEIEVDPTLAKTAIAITCDRNLLAYIGTYASSDELRIQTTASLAPKERCEVVVETPTLFEIDHRGDGPLEARGDIRELERITTSQFGDATVRDLDLDSLEVEVSDASGLTMSGATSELRIESSSRRAVHARDLAAKRVEVVSSDSGLVSVRASERVSGELRGEGDLEVFGDPAELDLTQSGAGEVLSR